MRAIEAMKSLISRLPLSWQMALRRGHYSRQVRAGAFESPEPEYSRLSEWVNPGDWVLDIGANIGNYTLELAKLVGSDGRVIAIEPIATTFSFLVRHVAQLGIENVTLLNVAASEHFDVVRMSIPNFESGLSNPYQATISADGDRQILAIPVDGLGIDRRVSFVKIDVEGHELSVLRGMRRLLEASHPVLVVEGDRQEFDRLLEPLGYSRKRFTPSPNTVYLPLETAR